MLHEWFTCEIQITAFLKFILYHSAIDRKRLEGRHSKNAFKLPRAALTQKSAYNNHKRVEGQNNFLRTRYNNTSVDQISPTDHGNQNILLNIFQTLYYAETAAVREFSGEINLSFSCFKRETEKKLIRRKSVHKIILIFLLDYG